MTPKVQDQGHRAADKELAKLIKRLQRSYRQASLNLQEKINAYMERFEKEDAAMRALYDSGELSHEDYMSWRCKKIAGTKQWKRMREQLATDLVNADKIAAKMIRDALPEIYAENHNYGTYEIERDLQMSTSYTLYNRDAVARLLQENPDLLPQPSVNVRKDERWNRQHIQSAVLQGILTGESMQKIAGRMQDVAEMDARAAMRNARTAVTGAENAGKLDSMRRAQGLGVQLKKMWLATRDSRTRDSHVLLDGEMVEIDKPFSNGCMSPGDPEGAPAEVYNCRCAMRSKVAGADPYSPDLSRNERLGGMSYDEWKQQAGERFFDRLSKEKDVVIITPKGSKISDIFLKIKDKITAEKSASEKIDDNDEEYKAFESKNVKPDLCLLCEKAGLKRVKARKLKETLTVEDIIDKICVNDESNGACTSLAFAYAANRVGLDVTDYRRGQSIGVFAELGWFGTAELTGVSYKETHVNTNHFEKARTLLGSMEPDKEYILSVGNHTAVVRIKEGEYQFLELQNPDKKGFRRISDTVLESRFGCTRANSPELAFLVDVDTLRDNDEFRAVVEYLNTKGM